MKKNFPKRLLVTGGLGFIGANFIKMMLSEDIDCIGNIDKITYASNLEVKPQFESDNRYRFLKSTLLIRMRLENLFLVLNQRWSSILRKSHVDRSIASSKDFIQTNVVGTFNLLEAFKEYMGTVDVIGAKDLRFIHVSTDEVYGSLGDNGLFRKNPNISLTHLIRRRQRRTIWLVFAHTHGVPVIITNCSNNFGPYQNLEKLIPTIISCCLQGQPIPVYGTGENIRDGIYVDDHNRAIVAAILKGIPGESYNIGANHEIKNIDLVKEICRLIDEMRPKEKSSYEELITFVEDRKGHDYRYAIDSSKARRSLQWGNTNTIQRRSKQNLTLVHGTVK